MKNEKLLAICLKTYPDEDYMQDWYDGNIKPCEVKIYYKGKKYWVTKFYNPEYYKLIDTKIIKT